MGTGSDYLVYSNITFPRNSSQVRAHSFLAAVSHKQRLSVSGDMKKSCPVLRI
ncbi:hypothetical protein BACPEC_03088 [[Bacteroides] pectinophilus ATCC 43243]|uniref:Uncharacterized protein n=1 Tax=[Bacteroides] pectinophilus ATCC 43243 TaxID=483218 RepID=B7AWI8_9FIRM|nr:hypothetical protein BACPEC_03088 [[Bacteroides] pectinophilus ATCC 43243]